MKNFLTIQSENGESKEYEILFTFESENTNKKYVTYTDFSKHENGDIACYSSIMDKDGKLFPVDTEKELKMIDEMLKTLTEVTRLKYKIEDN